VVSGAEDVEEGDGGDEHSVLLAVVGMIAITHRAQRRGKEGCKVLSTGLRREFRDAEALKGVSLVLLFMN